MAKEKEPIVLPAAFDESCEENKFLKGMKKKAVKNFSYTKMDSLYNVHDLAFFLYVFGRTDECAEVCLTAARVVFSGNFNIWSPVETTLALYSRILSEKGDRDAAKTVMDRVRAAGFVADRLSGELLDFDNIKEAVESGSKTDERDWRLSQLSELCFMKELGGSKSYPVEKIENLIQENLAALRNLLGVVRN